MAAHNTNILQKYNFNFRSAVRVNKNTTISPGYEFRSCKRLKLIWKLQSDWKKIRNTIFKGVKYPLKPDFPDATRLLDLKVMIKRGNHPSAELPEKVPIIRENYNKETTTCFMFPISPDSLTSIDHREMTPLGNAVQPTITEDGFITEKNRPIHDCSFKMKSGHSVNSRHLPELLDDCIYGQCLN